MDIKYVYKLRCHMCAFNPIHIQSNQTVNPLLCFTNCPQTINYKRFSVKCQQLEKLNFNLTLRRVGS